MNVKGASLRRVSVWLHRWVGLFMTIFLIVVGITGSLLAFNIELERYFAPHLFAHQRSRDPPLDLAILAEMAGKLVPQGRVVSVTYAEPDQVSVWFEPRINPETNAPFDIGFTEFFMDPSTGKELGRRVRGDLSQGLVNLMPFIYELHWRLALGDFGQWTLGIVAIAWTLDCFVSFFLTFPVSLKSFLRRWRPSWQIKLSVSRYRIYYDMHRASGLWLWPLLFIFAWSSVMMNMRGTYEPVMKTFFDYQSDAAAFEPSETPVLLPKLDWATAKSVGERLIKEESERLHFQVTAPSAMSYFQENGAYLYEVRGSNDLFERSPKGGGTYVMFDGNTGQLRYTFQPTHEHNGNTVESWLYALHMARVFGISYRVLVCLLGLVITVLSGTGVYIWWKKRKARVASHTRAVA